MECIHEGSNFASSACIFLYGYHDHCLFSAIGVLRRLVDTSVGKLSACFCLDFKRNEQSLFEASFHTSNYGGHASLVILFVSQVCTLKFHWGRPLANCNNEHSMERSEL